MGEVISVISGKGGTGKTTICFQIATMLALCGFNVLAIDLDPQAHLTNVLRFDENKKYKLQLHGEDFEKTGSFLMNVGIPIHVHGAYFNETVVLT